MTEVQIQKIIDAAGMGLNRIQTMRLLSITDHQLRVVTKKYGLNFVSGHIRSIKKQDEPTISKFNKDHPYSAVDKKARNLTYKKLMNKANTLSEREEITYGYCLYEFEYGKFLEKKRPFLPCRIAQSASIIKPSGAITQKDIVKVKINGILEIIDMLGEATCAEIARHSDLPQKSITSYLHRMFVDAMIDRETMEIGLHRSRVYKYSIRK
jgi:hypothetical protein